MEAIPGIESVSLSVGAPVSDNSFHTGFFLTEQGPEQGTYNVDVKTVDIAYLSTYNIKVAAGRWFTDADERLSDPEIPEDQRKYVYILNEAAVRKLGFNSPEEIIGKQITTGIGDLNAEVVGVLDDFHNTSLHEEIRPIVFVTMPNLFYEIGVKIKTENLKETLTRIETSWKELFPNDYYEYEFLDDHLAALYENDQKTFTLFKIFAGVSIFIGCLGLYGLISFVANQKRKEVGIRKVMGASVSSILVLFSKEFVRLIIVAFALAIPLTWYFMNLWLQSFAYKVDISWIIFLAGFISILVIVLLTIAYRSFVAARANPAITLRSE
jgi:ABC-type antimicrobial peptide transport system permease subunit